MHMYFILFSAFQVEALNIFFYISFIFKYFRTAHREVRLKYRPLANLTEMFQQNSKHLGFFHYLVLTYFYHTQVNGILGDV